MPRQGLAAAGDARPDGIAAELTTIERLIDLGSLTDALARLGALLKSAPRRAGDICLLMARAALAAGDGKQTAALLQLAEQQPPSPRLKLRLRCLNGELLRQQRRGLEAEPILRAVAERCRS